MCLEDPEVVLCSYDGGCSEHGFPAMTFGVSEPDRRGQQCVGRDGRRARRRVRVNVAFTFDIDIPRE
jgi:hypothetical protein